MNNCWELFTGLKGANSTNQRSEH
uniref:Uncharacterized protein n=1 Tax=Lepeophtheirus salmonis TaxID=72036 RepID=A0A0K2VB85_LEPSM